jgi:hypothetical protein
MNRNSFLTTDAYAIASLTILSCHHYISSHHHREVKRTLMLLMTMMLNFVSKLLWAEGWIITILSSSHHISILSSQVSTLT